VLAILSITLVVGGFGSYSYIKASEQLDGALKQHSNLILSQVELNAPQLMWDYETEQLQTFLSSFGQDHLVQALYIVDGAGVYYGIERNSVGVLETVEARPRGIEIYKEFSINYDDSGKSSELGKAFLAIDRSELENQLSSLAFTTVAQTFVLAVIIVMMLVSGLRFLLSGPLNEISLAIENITQGDGDLTRRLPVREDEIGIMVESFNDFVSNLQHLIKGVLKHSAQMEVPVNSVFLVAKQAQVGAESQRVKTTSVSTAMVQMSQAANEVALNASHASESAKIAAENAHAAEHELEAMSQSIRSLSDDISTGAQVINNLQSDVVNIVSVLDVIRSIAEQTNLLALNAAIEAARAGEQGRGFAVVADEVRSLASKTQDSTQEIQQMISRLEEGSSKAVEVMQVGKNSGEKALNKVSATQEIVREIYQAILKVNDMNGQIASAAEEQTAVSSEVNELLSGIVEVVDKVVVDAADTYNTSEQLMSLIKEFDCETMRFKV